MPNADRLACAVETVLIEYPHGNHAGHGQQRVIVSGDGIGLEMRERCFVSHIDALPDAIPEVAAERSLWIVGDGLSG